MSKVVLLIGRIGSGKSYFASLMKNEHNALVLSSDELMLSLFDGCLGERHREFERKCYMYLCAVAKKAIASGLDVILDFGCWFESEVSQIKAYFENENIQLEIVYIHSDDAVRRERIRKRNELLLKADTRQYIIDEQKLARFDERFEEPAYFDRLIEN